MNDKITLTEFTTSPIIEVKNLYKKFGALEVLQGVSLDIHKGDVVAIIGPSGCGKSTFLRCLNLLEQPNAGQITLNGEYVFKNERVYLKRKMRAMKQAQKQGEPLDEPTYNALKAEYEALRETEKAIEKTVTKQINIHRQKIGMVFQQFNLFPHLTVLKNITLAPVKLKKMTEHFDMGFDYIDDEIYESLSEEEKQKIDDSFIEGNPLDVSEKEIFDRFINYVLSSKEGL